jgi:hypothetical protein
MKRLVACLAAALLVAGCSSSTQALPAGSILPTPVVPAGWASIGAIGGSGGGVGTELALNGHETALHVACSGIGTVVVQFGDATQAPAPAVVFRCGWPEAVESRYELTDPILGSATVIVSVVEGYGALHASSFMVSFEQPEP